MISAVSTKNRRILIHSRRGVEPDNAALRTGPGGHSSAKAGLMPRRGGLFSCYDLNMLRERRKKRIDSGTFALVSLAGCFAWIMLWVRGYLVLSSLSYGRPGWMVVVTNATGRLEFGWHTGHIAPVDIGLRWLERPPVPPLPWFWIGDGAVRIGGFSISVTSNSTPPTGTIRWVAIPHYALAALWMVIPLRWLRRAIVPPPDPGAICQQCGYDLRATPERCPECGATPKVQD